jgi:hypothetical protein
MSNTETKAPEQKLQSVTLQTPHSHGGIDYAEGDKIEVNEADKAWLIANQIIAAPAAK